MKNFAEINRASTGAKKTNQLFEKLWEHSRTLKRVGLVLVMCLTLCGNVLGYDILAGKTIYFDNYNAEWTYPEMQVYQNEGNKPSYRFNQLGTTTFYYYVFDDKWGGFDHIYYYNYTGSGWGNKSAQQRYDINANAVIVPHSGSEGCTIGYFTTFQKAYPSNRIYFDATGADGWGNKAYFRYGFDCVAHAESMTKFPGTASLFYIDVNEAYFEKYTIANNCGDIQGNTVYQPSSSCKPTGANAITHSLNFSQSDINGGDSKITTCVITTPKSSTADGCDWYNYTKTGNASIPTQTVNVGSVSNGKIRVDYYNTSGEETYWEGSGGTSLTVPQSAIITVTAIPNTGYYNSALTVGGGAFTSGSTYTVTATTAIAATFARSYAFIEGRFRVYNAARNTRTSVGAQGTWVKNSTNIPMSFDGTNGRFELHTYSTPAELKAAFTGGEGDADPYFYIKTSTASNSISSGNDDGPAEYWATSTSSNGNKLLNSGTANKRAVSKTSDALTFVDNSSSNDEYVILYCDGSYVWYDLEYTLEYSAGTGSGTAPASKTYYNKGSKATVASNTFTAPSGYHFHHWSGSDGNTYAASDKVTMNSNVTLTAIWALDYPTGYIYITDVMATPATKAGTTITATKNSANYKTALSSTFNTNRVGYEEWAITTGSGNYNLAFSSALDLSSYSGGVDIDVWWGANDKNRPTYIKINGGSQQDLDAVTTAGDRNQVRKATYHTDVTSLSSVQVLGPSSSGDNVVWFRIGIKETATYALTYDDNTDAEVSNMPTSPVNKPAGTITLASEIPTRSGYAFQGWTEDEENEGTVYAAGGSYTMPASAQTLYAKWAQTYTLTYDDGDGSGAPSAEEHVPGSITLSSTEPTRSGYVFLGWTVHGGDGTLYAAGGSYTMPSSNVTLDAEWEEICFQGILPTSGTKVTFGASSTTYDISTSSTVTSGGAITIVNNAGSDKDYTFSSNGMSIGTTSGYIEFTLPTGVTITTGTKIRVQGTGKSASEGLAIIDDSGTAVSSQTAAAIDFTYTLTAESAIKDKGYIRINRVTGSTTHIKSVTVTGCGEQSCSAIAPGSISKGSASGGTGIITLTAAGDPATNNTWYWQASADGTSTSVSGKTKNVSAAGTYYLRSYCSDNGGCWSDAVSVTVAAADLLTTPTATFSNGAYTIGSSALNLSSLWSSDSEGSVTYTVQNANGTGATISTAAFTATTAGTATVRASQAADGNYSAIYKDATITVSNPTYSVTYKANNSTAESDVVEDAESTFGDNPSFTAPSTKAFAGWNTEADGSGTHYDVGDAVPRAITVYAEWRYKVYYIASSTSESNDVTAALASKYVVSVKETTGTSYNASDYSDYALVVLSESLNGSDAGTDGHELKVIVGLNKPILNLKSYFYGANEDSSKRWQWGAPNAGKNSKGIYVKNDTYANLTSHPIYSGLTPNGSDSIMILFTTDSDKKPIQPIGSFTSGKEGYSLALVKNNTSGNGTAIHELTAAQRSTITGQSISAKYLLISLYSKDLSHLTTDGKTLIKNAADYLITGSQWVPQYAITKSATNGSIATEVSSSAVTSAAAGSRVDITATPTTGYDFSSWSVYKTGDPETTVSVNSTTTSPTYFTMPAYAVTVEATFVRSGFTLTNVVNTVGYGTVSPASVADIPNGTTTTTSSNTYTVNGTTVTATPASNTAEYTYEFSSWSGLPATVAANATVTANFTRTPVSYTLTHEAAENGSYTINGESGNTTGAFGSTVTLVATPDSHYKLQAWNVTKTSSGDAVSMATANTFVMPAEDVTIAPTFGRVYTVTFRAYGGSSVSPIEQTTVGGSITMPSTTTSNDSTFTGWMIGGTTIAAGASYTPTADVYAYATWQKNCAGGGGSGSATLTANTTSGQVGYTKGNDSCNWKINNVRFILKNTGGASSSRKIYVDGGSTINESTFQMSQDASSTPNNNYIDIRVGSDTIIDSLCVRCAQNGTSTGRAVAFCFGGESQVDVNNSVIDTVTFPIISNAGTSSTAPNIKVVMPASTRSVRIYKKVKYDATNKKICTSGTAVPSSPQSFNVASIIVYYHTTAAACYHITYDGNGADAGYENDARAYSSGDNAWVSTNSSYSNSFTREGYEFNGWNNKADGSGTDYDYWTSSDHVVMTQDTTLYAQWRIIIDEDNTNVSGFETPQYKDVAVRNGATLTITEDMSVRNITVESGSTLHVAKNGEEGVTFATKSLSLKGGYYTKSDYSESYDMPRVYIDPASKITRTNKTINFDFAVTNNYHPIAVPFPVKVYDVNYVKESLAYIATYGNHYNIKTYDGAARANGSYACWTSVPSMEYVGPGEWKYPYLEPGRGYILAAKRGKGDPYAVIRFPMKNVEDDWLKTGELGHYTDGESVTHVKDTVRVTAYLKEGDSDGSKTPKTHKGWNILGIPYMSCYQTSADMYDGDGSATIMQGRFDFDTNTFDDKDETRYVSVPTHDFSEYLQYDITDEDTKLLPGWCFFVQIETTGRLTFLSEKEMMDSDLPYRAPKRENASMPTVKTGIILSGAGAKDKTTILVSDRYNGSEYEINADLEKMFGETGYTLATYSLMGSTRLAYNAMNNTDIMNVIPVGYRAPEEGDYTFSINPRYAENFEQVNLIDYETGILTNLLLSSYTFSTERTQNDARFALNVVPRQDTPTGIENGADSNKDANGVRKVLIENKLYIILDGKMYDATGKSIK